MGNLLMLVKFSVVLLFYTLDYTRADNELQGNKNLLYLCNGVSIHQTHVVILIYILMSVYVTFNILAP